MDDRITITLQGIFQFENMLKSACGILNGIHSFRPRFRQNSKTGKLKLPFLDFFGHRAKKKKKKVFRLSLLYSKNSFEFQIFWDLMNSVEFHMNIINVRDVVSFSISQLQDRVFLQYLQVQNTVRIRLPNIFGIGMV